MIKIYLVKPLPRQTTLHRFQKHQSVLHLQNHQRFTRIMSKPHSKSFLEECSKYSSVATKMMTNQFNVFHLYLKDVRRFNSNLGGFLAAHSSLECAENVKHDEELTSIVKEYIEELK